MSRSPSALPLLLTVFLASTGALAQPKEGGNAIGAVKTSYSCEQADALKFDKTKYYELTLDDRVILDAQWNRCDQLKRQKTGQSNSQEVVVFANPAPAEGSSRVFYGTMSRSNLENAKKNCAGGGKAVGIGLQVVGATSGVDETGQLGRAVFNYSDVSCEGLAQGLAADNVMVFIAPQDIVVHAVQKQLTGEILKPIPFISATDKKNIANVIDKATRPPEVTIKKNEVQVKTPLGTAKLRAPKF